MASRDEMEMEDVNGSQFQNTFMKPLKNNSIYIEFRWVISRSMNR